MDQPDIKIVTQREANDLCRDLLNMAKDEEQRHKIRHLWAYVEQQTPDASPTAENTLLQRLEMYEQAVSLIQYYLINSILFAFDIDPKGNWPFTSIFLDASMGEVCIYNVALGWEPSQMGLAALELLGIDSLDLYYNDQRRRIWMCNKVGAPWRASPWYPDTRTHDFHTNTRNVLAAVKAQGIPLLEEKYKLFLKTVRKLETIAADLHVEHEGGYISLIRAPGMDVTTPEFYVTCYTDDNEWTAHGESLPEAIRKLDWPPDDSP